MNNNIKCVKENDVFTVKLFGRIDTTNSAEIESALMAAAADEPAPVLDMAELEYISSAGLRVLMKLLKRKGCRLKMLNVSDAVYDILETTGFTELFDVSRKMREISVEGCPVIGKGYYGTVYRIDEETIVKVYNFPDSIEMIKNEKKLARTALVAGVPTAISYDIVRVGDGYGSVFELLNAKTLNDMLVEAQDDVDSMTRKYAEFFHLVNSRTVPDGKLRSAKEQFMGYLEVVRRSVDSSLYERLKTLLEEIPEQNNVVHGDAQMKNVMVVDDEPMLVDMDTVCVGHPIFDLQAVYVTYFAFGEDEPENSMNFLGLPASVSHRVWEKFIGYYFDTDDEALIAQYRDKISIVGCIRFMYLIDCVSDYGTELYKLRVKHTAERLKKLADRVDTLLF